MKEPFTYTICGICGEKFIKPVGSIYRVKFANRMCNCCSYKCYRIAKEVKDSNVSIQYARLLSENSSKLKE